MGINDDEMDDDIDKDERGGLKRGFIVDFDGNRVCFDNSRASDFILAYAITIHKSQGSEYDIVVMPTHDGQLHNASEKSAVYGSNES